MDTIELEQKQVDELNMKDQFQELIIELRNGGSMAAFVADLNCEAQPVSVASGWMWQSGPQLPGLLTLYNLMRYGATERAREFGRRGLAIYGLRLVEG